MRKGSYVPGSDDDPNGYLTGAHATFDKQLEQLRGSEVVVGDDDAVEQAYGKLLNAGLGSVTACANAMGGATIGNAYYFENSTAVSYRMNCGNVVGQHVEIRQ